MRLSMTMPLHLWGIFILTMSFISFLSCLNIITSCGQNLMDDGQLWTLQQNKENQLQQFLQTQIGDLIMAPPSNHHNTLSVPVSHKGKECATPPPVPYNKAIGVNGLCQPQSLMWCQLQPLMQDCLSKKEKSKSGPPARPIIALILQHARAVGIESCAYVLHILLLRIGRFK